MPDPQPVCTLPSSDTACRLLAGDPMGLLLMVRDLAVRGALVGGGLYIAGMHKPREVLRYGLAGALAIEACVLTYTFVKGAHPGAAPTPQIQSGAVCNSGACALPPRR